MDDKLKEKAFDTIRDALESLWAEIERLRAQHAAAVCAWEEYAHIPGLQPITVGKVQYPDGTIKDLALHPDQIMGLLQGIEKQVRECLPFGVEAVRARQNINGLRVDLAHWKARAEKSEKALQEIAGYGIVFDAKGTWSKRINEIARAALEDELCASPTSSTNG